MVIALTLPQLGPAAGRAEEGSGHCFPLFWFPPSIPPLPKLLTEGEEDAGQESDDQDSVAVNQHLLSSPAGCSHLTLVCCGGFGKPLPSPRVYHQQLTRQESMHLYCRGPLATSSTSAMAQSPASLPKTPCLPWRPSERGPFSVRS